MFLIQTSKCDRLGLHKLHGDIWRSTLCSSGTSRSTNPCSAGFDNPTSSGDLDDGVNIELTGNNFRDLEKLVLAYSACNNEELLRGAQFRRCCRHRHGY
jgi:hypothetical protein